MKTIELTDKNLKKQLKIQEELINQSEILMSQGAKNKKQHVDTLWALIREEYPETKGFVISYDSEKGIIKILRPEKGDI